MLKIYDVNFDGWNEIVKSFHNWDIYFLKEYAVSFKIHGDGDPYLVYFENKDCSICFVVMKKDISHFKMFNGVLADSKYFDYTSPYGYGGPLMNGVLNQSSLLDFRDAYFEYCKENSIISQFIRFNPILDNHTIFSDFCELTYVKNTIYIDTNSQDIIWNNIASKNRNMIRKAQKNGVKVYIDNGEDLSSFIKIYNKTMDQNRAQPYYYFDNVYYDYIFKNLKENVVLFLAKIDENIIAGAIFLFNKHHIHYHLSGLLEEYRNSAAMNLIIYEAALFATQKGIKSMHLGGGVGVNDGLFNFKKKFNKNGELPFYLGRNVFMKKEYNDLLILRKKSDPDFDVDNKYLIQYRR